MKYANGKALVWGFTLVFNLLLFSNLGRAQIWSRIMLEQGTEPQAVDVGNVPSSGTFWSLQRPYHAPLPFNAFPDLPVFCLGYGNAFLLDDTSVDYEAIYKQREEERALRKLEWEAGLVSDEEYFALEGTSAAMMMSSMLTSYAYGNGVYLVDMVASATNGLTTTSFSIAGGTNNVPYDILTSTNVAAVIADWNWIGISYTSNRYTFSNQPPEQAFYILAKPQKTMVVGWGDDDYQQSGLQMPLTNALQVAGGRAHSIALLGDGMVVGWGNNYLGQLNIPTNLLGAAMISCGYYHSLALQTNGSVAAWGYNDTYYNLLAVPADLTNAAVISANGLHSLALRSNATVVAWGLGPSGETSVPSGLSNVVAIAAGYQHNLAVKDDGTVTAWGYNGSGQCNVPAGLTNVWDVAAGAAHSLALRKDGTVVAWGGNTYGETNVPTGLSNFVAIAAGGEFNASQSFSMALRQDNTVVMWGDGLAVTPLTGMSNVIAIAGGTDHGLAVRSGPRTPVITLQPADQFQIAGGNVTFNSRGTGLYDVEYQWKTNGVNLVGATNAALTLTNVQAAQVGSYTVTVSNEVGTITSPNATLTLVTAPIILTQTPLPTNQTAIYHRGLTLSVTVSAPGQNNGFPVSYQWKFNGTNISGAITNSYTLFGGPDIVGSYSVTVTNAAGSANTSWQVTNVTFVGSYLDVGTLAYHLSTNLVGRTNGFTPGANMVEVSGWTWEYYYPTNLPLLTNSMWTANFWLQVAKGLSATAIGFLNRPGGQGLVTMVSPRHCVFATHMHVGQDHFVAAFLDTNNVIHWRTNVETLHLGYDTSVGILDSDLPSAVEYLSIAPTNLSLYLTTNSSSVVQGLGMNQHLKVFSHAMTFDLTSISWKSSSTAPFGLTTNWNIVLGGGDSSAPGRLLIGDQLVLVTHNTMEDQTNRYGSGPNYAFLFNAINEAMHYLSTNNSVSTDYQLTPFSLTGWPIVN